MTGRGRTPRRGRAPDAGGSPADAALAALLAAAHAAVYGYGVLGARLDEAGRRAAVLARDGVRARRDQLARTLVDRGRPAPPPAADYAVQVADPPAALALAVALEVGLGQRWRDLVAATDDPALRRLGVAGLTESAVRAAQWRLRAGTRPATEPLPGG